MNGYINNIVSRHSEPGLNISPRLPGLFEMQYSRTASLQEEQDTSIATTGGRQAMAEKNNLPAGDERWPQTGKPGKTDKAHLNNNKQDQPGKKRGTIKHEKTTEFSEPSIVPHSLKDNPLNMREIFSPNILPLQTGPDQQANKKEKINTTIIPNEKPVVTPVEQPVYRLSPGDIGGTNGSFSLTEQEKNTGPGKEKVMYNNTLLTSLPGYPSVLPKEISASAIINYHEGTSVIKVSIGRIEVKAMAAAPQALKATTAKPSSPKMSLEEYLKKRNDAEQ